MTLPPRRSASTDINGGYAVKIPAAPGSNHFLADLPPASRRLARCQPGGPEPPEPPANWGNGRPGSFLRAHVGSAAPHFLWRSRRGHAIPVTAGRRDGGVPLVAGGQDVAQGDGLIGH